ncbi:MAG: methyltransferase, partial [Alphaproteobacteria bacterium]|nr:methyltransferase [Alphaproteobacteria bacterium]
MSCPYQENCGGCLFRNLSEEEYRAKKIVALKGITANLTQKDLAFGETVFIGDNARRRAEFSFEMKRGKLIFGYNQRKTHDIINIEDCPLLTEALNLALPKIRAFLADLCAITVTKKLKRGKPMALNVQKGQIFLTSCANGIDINLETFSNPELEHRLLIADFINENTDIIRFSWKNQQGNSEIIAQKSAPLINIADYQIKIPSATFLQASDQAEKALIALVQKYLADISGNIADLFCGIGTFSYPLSRNIKNKLTSVDSSFDLLEAFQKNINANEIPNIKILKRNLFKYPLEG